MMDENAESPAATEEAQPREEDDRLAAPVDMEQPPRLPFPVAGIGASAGGLEAYIEFMKAMPPDAGMAFVLIQHLPPDHQSMMVEILSKHTEMPVQTIEDGMAVEANHVYLIRPGYTPTIKGGRLHLGEPLEKPRHGHPIDDFFRSLAEEQRECSMAVILSGMGSNGTAGAQQIKAVGGLVIAQDPTTTEFPSMPRSVIDMGNADLVLPPAEIPQALIRFAAHASARRAGAPESAPATDNQQFLQILNILRSRVRHDFGGYKKPTVVRRIQRRMGLNQIHQLQDYVALLRQSPHEASALSDDLMIHVTGFFRDPEAWTALYEDVILPLVKERAFDQPIRCWVTACSTGEEAYTLAMLITEACEEVGRSLEVKIFATDMAERTLAHARNGIYPQGIEADIAPERLERFFEKEDSFYRINRELREMVIFAPQNVVQDPPFSRLDICTCRNLLIYLEPDLQRRVLGLLHFALREGGFLFLGTSETASGCEGMFERLNKRSRTYRRIGPSRSGTIDFQMPFGRAGAVDPPLPKAVQRLTIAQQTTRVLLEQLTPAAVTVDQHYHVVYYHGDSGRFLRQPSGEPTRDLMVMARDTIRGAIRTVLQQAALEKGRAVSRDGFVGEGDERPRVEVMAIPLEAKGSPTHYLVSFRELDRAPLASPPGAGEGNGEGNGEPAAAKSELARVREDLEGTIEELQTSNEELKASHEEVISVNEELQSTNEELETSKEEMQSMNEELRTVNTQLQHKIEEHEAISNDLGSLLSSIDLAVVFLDSQFRIRRYTPTATDLFDLIPSDIGRPINNLARKFDDPALAADCQKVLDQLTPIEREVTSASSQLYLRRILPYRTSDDHIRGMVLTFTNITERKAIEVALHAHEQRLRMLIKGSADFAIILMDRAGTILSWNAGAEQLLGYSEEEAIGREAALIFVPEERETAPQQELQQAVRHGLSHNERWYLPKGGGRFFGSGTLTAVRDAAGNVDGYVKVLRDETNREAGESERRELLGREQTARGEAERATRIRDQFMATLSHELRTPLSSILMWAKMLRQRDAEPKELQEGLLAIERSAESQRQLLDDMIDTSRIASGKLRLDLAATNLSALTQSAIDALRPLADEKHVEIATEFPADMPATALDPSRIRQVLNNLLTNAIKFTPGGGQVGVKLEREKDTVEIRVADTGTGIEPAFLPFVFTAFSQADNSNKRSFGGLGLGLSIAKQLVEAHGGTLSVQSDGRGRGATFTVRLPFVSAEELKNEEAADVADGSALFGRGILLVEDNLQSREALARLLTAEGARVVSAGSVDEAWKAYRQAPPDLVISDIGLPEKDGYELMQMIRSWETEHMLVAVPALALTAFAGREDSRKSREAGFQLHIAKPVDPDELLRVLARLLARP
jgi:two-component system CheB/CheR fusion protein